MKSKKVDYVFEVSLLGNGGYREKKKNVRRLLISPGSDLYALADLIVHPSPKSIPVLIRNKI